MNGANKTDVLLQAMIFGDIPFSHIVCQIEMFKQTTFWIAFNDTWHKSSFESVNVNCLLKVMPECRGLNLLMECIVLAELKYYSLSVLFVCSCDRVYHKHTRSVCHLTIVTLIYWITIDHLLF